MIQVKTLSDPQEVAREAASIVADLTRRSIQSRGRFVFAVSGGSTPWRMLRLLADEALAWQSIHVFQVDERIAPAGSSDRNLTHLRESLLERVPIPTDNVHPMPVEESDPKAAMTRYQHSLEAVSGSPPVLDLVHLGLGADGHTASLLPGDPALEITDTDIAITGEYRGYRRMTLTYPLLNRARHRLWLVTGVDKAPMLATLYNGDTSIPAGLIERKQAIIIADRDACEGVKPSIVDSRSK